MNFVIKADFINQTCRDLCLEGDWQKAINILKSINEEVDSNMIESFIKGEKEFIELENNYFDFVNVNKEDKLVQEYINSLNKKLDSTLYLDNNFFTPYAYVDGWSNFDKENCENIKNKDANDFTRKFNYDFLNKIDDSHIYQTFMARSLIYAKNPESDLAYIDKKQNCVFLYERCKSPVPFFLIDKIPTSPEKVKTKHCLNYSAIGEIDNSINIDNCMVNFSNFEVENNSSISDDEIEQITNSIKKYADDDKEYGWKILVDPSSDKILKVPYRALLHYATGMLKSGKINLPIYKPFSPSGIKMINDNPYHTDLLLGSGIPLEEAYNYDIWQNKLIFEAAAQIQFESDIKNHILSRGGLEKIEGTICSISSIDSIKDKKILVLPHLGIEFEKYASMADAIICENGGPLSHLVTVIKEGKSIPIVRVNDAVLAFLEPKKIKIDLLDGNISYVKDKNIKINKI